MQSTLDTPADNKAWVQARKVLPVVSTSSTNTTRWPSNVER
jgi:hypothetical protein